jgi:hypothetical protein
MIYINNLFLIITFFILISFYFFRDIPTNKTIGIFLIGLILWYYYQNRNEMTNKEDFSNGEMYTEAGLANFKYLIRDPKLVNNLITISYLREYSPEMWNEICMRLDLICEIYTLKDSQWLNPTASTFQRVKDNLLLVLNTLTSLILNIPALTTIIVKRGQVWGPSTIEFQLKEVRDNIKDRGQEILDEIQNTVNKDWNNGNVNMFSMPVYPGQPEPWDGWGYNKDVNRRFKIYV